MSNSVHVIACGVLAVDIREIVRQLGMEVTLEFLPGGLHASPLELKRRLQERIDAVSAEDRGGRIVVAYGICGMGTAGIYARSVPLVIPRVHDCIALFLGSDAAYRREFARFPGTYYISAGWVEEKAQPQSTQERPIQCGPDCFTFQQLLDKYGPENAEAIHELTRTVRQRAHEAGTDETRVEILVHDHVAPAADGSQIFLGRDLTACLAGRPTVRLGCGTRPELEETTL